MIVRWIYVFILYCFVEAQVEPAALGGGNNSNQNITRNGTTENPTAYSLYDSSLTNEGRAFPSGHFGEPFIRTPNRRYHPGPIKIGSGSKPVVKQTSNSYAKIPDTRYQPQNYESFPPYAPEEATKPPEPETMMDDDGDSDKGQQPEDYSPYKWGYGGDTDNNDDDNPVVSKHPVYHAYSDYMPEEEKDDAKDEDANPPPEYEDHHPWNYHPTEEEDDDMGEHPKMPMNGGKNKKPEYLDHPPWHSAPEEDYHPNTEDEDDEMGEHPKMPMNGGKNKKPEYLDHPPWHSTPEVDYHPKEEEEDVDMGKPPKRPMNGGKHKKPEYLDHPPWHSAPEEDYHPKEEEEDVDMGKPPKRPMNGGKHKKPEYLDHPPWHSEPEEEDDKKPEDDDKKSKHKYPQFLDHPPWKDSSMGKPKPPTYPPWYSTDVKTPEKDKPSYFIDEMKDQGKENHGGYWDFHGQAPEKEEEDHHTMDEERNKRPYSYYYLGRKLWYIPLYFSAYFIIYVTALILRSIARHKIAYPLYHNVDWAGRSGGNYITQLSDTVSEAISNTAKKYL